MLYSKQIKIESFYMSINRLEFVLKSPWGRMECSSVVVYLGGVEFAVVQLQDVEGCLEVGLRL